MQLEAIASCAINILSFYTKTPSSLPISSKPVNFFFWRELHDASTVV